MASVMIGLALYQGAAHIEAQLDSIAAQTHRDWRLVVSDDGSEDEGPEIVRSFAERHPAGRIEITPGPRKGASQNFLSLIGQARPGEYLAWCDQDDVWLPDKLEHALEMLAAHPAAGLYSSRTTICDDDLTPITGARRFSGPFNFRNALVQAVTSGNTCVLPPRSLAVARRAAAAAAGLALESHDWWLYQLISGAGMEVIRDDVEMLLYRQHAENLKGRNDTAAAMYARLSQLFEGAYGGWLHENVRALSNASAELTPENAVILRRFDKALSRRGWRMATEFARLGLRRQTVPGTIALYAAALTGRLRRN